MTKHSCLTPFESPHNTSTALHVQKIGAILVLEPYKPFCDIICGNSSIFWRKKPHNFFLSLNNNFQNWFSRRENKLTVGLILAMKHHWSTRPALLTFLCCMTQQQNSPSNHPEGDLDCLKMRKNLRQLHFGRYTDRYLNNTYILVRQLLSVDQLFICSVLP